MKKIILLRLINKRDAVNYMELYKSHDIIRYVNSNYTGNHKDQKSIIGYYFFINRTIVI